MSIDDELDRYRTVFESIYRSQPADVLELSWDRFVDEIMHAPVGDWFDTLVNNHLRAMQRGHNNKNTALIVELDWKAEDSELTWAANRVLRHQGIEPTFDWRILESGSSTVQLGLHAFDEWLDQHERTLVNFETSADWYALAVVENGDLPAMLLAANNLTKPSSSEAELVTTIPESWAIDPVPRRPKKANPGLHVLWWAEPPEDGGRPRWSPQFTASEVEFSTLYSEADIEKVEARYRELHPDRLTMRHSVSKTRVVHEVPDEWFVVYEKPPHPDSYGAHRFEGPFLRSENGRYVGLCKDLSEALAYVNFTDASNATRGVNQSVITLAEARALENT